MNVLNTAKTLVEETAEGWGSSECEDLVTLAHKEIMKIEISHRSFEQVGLVF